MPTAAIREARRAFPNAAIVDGRTPPVEMPEWSSLAVDDLCGAAASSFRSFLWAHAQGALTGREALPPLVELHEVFRRVPAHPPSPATFIERIAERYPRPTDGQMLKRNLFELSSSTLDEFAAGAGHAAVLRALATTANCDAFDPGILPVEEESRKLWAEDPASAMDLVELLVYCDGNAFGERLLSSLTRTMQLADAVQALERSPNLGTTLARVNPGIVTASRMWRGPADRQRELFDAALASRSLPEGFEREVVVAMLQAGSDAVARRVVDVFGPQAVSAVMSWFDAGDLNSPSDLPQGWRRALSDRADALLDWLASAASPREASYALIADAITPHAEDVHTRGVAVWLRPRRESEGTVPTSAKNRLSAFLLALGFDNPGPRSDELVAESFLPVHQALASETLSYDCWAWLQPQVPTLSWRKNWDKCERLRRGLIEKFVAHDWPISEFVRCGADQEVLVRMLESCSKTDAGSIVRRRLRDALSAGTLKITDDAQSVIRRRL
jgi:hypothetical protein